MKTIQRNDLNRIKEGFRTGHNVQWKKGKAITAIPVNTRRRW